MKVLILSNQDISGIHASWKKEGEQARAEHLWGATTLSKHGIDVEILPFEKYKPLKNLSKGIKILGDLDQQLRTILTCSTSQIDAIYSAHHLTTPLLAALRKLRILRTPVVAIAYQSMNPSFWGNIFTQLCVDGNDQIICLSQKLKDDLIQDFNINPAKISVAEWGGDLPFYPIGEAVNEPHSKPIILSAGKTYRDYPTLLAAIETLNCELQICGHAYQEVRRDLTLPTNAVFYNEVLPWRAVLERYRKAYAVAIPLADKRNKPKNAVGLTNLLEAMAMGKPVVMTRNNLSRYVVDIEAEGIGIWVETGDVNGWQEALGYLLNHPEAAHQMGAKARQLAEQEMNLNVFSRKVASALSRVGLVNPAVKENVESMQTISSIER